MKRQQRQKRRRYFLAAESLEPRLVMSANIGVNLGSNSIYSSDFIWTDLRNEAAQWAPATPGATLPLTATDYPLADASTSFGMSLYPDGNYAFSYTGTATVTFTDIGQLAGPVTVSGGVTSGTVVINHQTGDGANLSMQVTGLDPAAPMANFHLMMPGYGNGTTTEPMFTPTVLHTLAPFSNIRFLNWDEVNNSTVSNWSDRVTPADFCATCSGGVPYEYMIELANESQKDMWINIPAAATPQFVQSLAQLVYANLDSNLHVYVEYGNENWNTGFTQYSQVVAAASSNPLVPQNSPDQMETDQSAYASVEDGITFDQVFGSRSAQVRPILPGFAAWSPYVQAELQYIQQTFGPPSQYIYAAAIAPYVGLPDGDNVPGLTLDQLFADLNQNLNDSIIQNIQTNAQVASAYGLPLVAYEGGQSLVPNGNEPVIAAAQNDPRMYQLIVNLVNDWDQAGGSMFDAYALNGLNGYWGYFDMLPNVSAVGGQEYDALVSLVEPAGDANMDGTVDDADFQTLAANYGQTGAYWEQGDFNDDGIVNWQDLNILRQNINPAGFTLQQFANQAVFGPSTVASSTSLEYDGYGVTYASSLPFAASSGTVKRNLNSQGQTINLNGATYSEGLGVLANSSISIALNGNQSRFESTIGVDGSSDTGSSVVFDVYGDNTLLYQSPTMTYASRSIPIDLNVAGVNTLNLVVVPAPGSNSSIDNAAWADARLVSTANFGATQPYALTWTLSQNGTVVSTQTTDSFVFGAISGTYTLALTVTDAQGDTATASTTVSVNSSAATASFIKQDTTTQGNWIGTYGSQGYDVIGNTSSLPSYATVTPAGQSNYTWAATTTDPRALQNAGGSGRIAATWYSGPASPST